MVRLNCGLVTALSFTLSVVAITPVVVANGVTYKGSTNAQGQHLFRGVPFSAPRTGIDRFKPPLQPSLAKGTVVDASKNKQTCHKVTESPEGQSEDCLYLNIQTPANLNNGKLPVIFYIFGGGFQTGSVGGYDGRFLLELGEQQNTPVIFVTASYRLAGWGFLTGSEAAKAGYSNIGLLDQQMALKWIKANIRAFGGDPNKVLLVGQSSGAISVGLHLLNPSNKGLFRNAMMLSGSPSTVGIGHPNARQLVFDRLVEKAGCSKASKVLDCLAKISESAFHKAVFQASTGMQGYNWAPQIGGSFIDDSPSELIQAGKMLNLPLISGSVLDEGPYFLEERAFSSISDVVSGILNAFPRNTISKSAVTKLVGLYSRDPSEGSPYRTGKATFSRGKLGKLAASVLGDVMFDAPRRDLLAHARGKHWAYTFFGTRPDPKLGADGVAHGSDIPYWYNDQDKLSEDERALGQKMASYLLNFAHHGHPNGEGLPFWPEYSTNYTSQQLKTSRTFPIHDTSRSEEKRYIIQNPLAFFH